MGASSAPGPSLVLDQSLHFIDQVPSQLQDLFGVVALGHLCNTDRGTGQVRAEQPPAHIPKLPSQGHLALESHPEPALRMGKAAESMRKKQEPNPQHVHVGPC